jgi:hypothetical protein
VFCEIGEKTKLSFQLLFVELGKKRNCHSNCCLLELDEKNNDKTKCNVVENNKGNYIKRERKNNCEEKDLLKQILAKASHKSQKNKKFLLCVANKKQGLHFAKS